MQTSPGMMQANIPGIGLGLCQALAESGADVVSLQLPTEPTGNKVNAALNDSQFQPDHSCRTSLRRLERNAPSTTVIYLTLRVFQLWCSR